MYSPSAKRMAELSSAMRTFLDCLPKPESTRNDPNVNTQSQRNATMKLPSEEQREIAAAQRTLAGAYLDTIEAT